MSGNRPSMTRGRFLQFKSSTKLPFQILRMVTAVFLESLAALGLNKLEHQAGITIYIQRLKCFNTSTSTASISPVSAHVLALGRFHEVAVAVHQTKEYRDWYWFSRLSVRLGWVILLFASHTSESQHHASLVPIWTLRRQRVFSSFHFPTPTPTSF